MKKASDELDEGTRSRNRRLVMQQRMDGLEKDFGMTNTEKKTKTGIVI